MGLVAEGDVVGASRGCPVEESGEVGGAAFEQPEYRWGQGGYPVWAAADREPGDQGPVLIAYRHRDAAAVRPQFSEPPCHLVAADAVELPL